jgi:4-amino-4-deoxychorismate lyase
MPIQYPLISVNGVISAQLSPLDRGFAYGDGLFETCCIFAGAIPLWEWHEERLQQGCERLIIPLDKARLADYLVQLLDVSGVREGVLKITLSRGVGGRGYRLPDQISPTYCVAVYEHTQNNLNQQGIAVRICRQRLAASPSLAGIKHLNRLEQILARAEWQDDSYAEGLMLDEAGVLIEATASNLFIVRNGQLLTPDLACCGVAGVMRRVIIEQLAPSLTLTTQITRLTPDDLNSADEIFLCNSVYGIWPVLRIAGEPELNFPNGEVTVRLQQALENFLRSRVLSEAKV